MTVLATDCFPPKVQLLQGLEPNDRERHTARLKPCPFKDSEYLPARLKLCPFKNIAQINQA